jgi:putative transposase
MKVQKRYVFKLNPTREQIILLNKHFGSVRYIFNYFLNKQKSEYDTNKKYLNYFANSKALTELKLDEDYKWLKDVSAQSLQQSLKHLECAFKRFFKKTSKFPKFKSKRSKNSFSCPQDVLIDDNKLFIHRFREGIKINLHTKFEGKIKQCTVFKTSAGKYFVSVLFETIHDPFPKTGKQVGIDLGLKDFAITSDGIKFKNHKFTKKYAKKLKRAQQHLSRKKKGSNRFEKQRLKVAKIYEKISNSRKDNLHKISHQLVSEYDFISIEDLNVKGMVKNKKLAKHISDASWSTFVSFLTYKASWNEKKLIKINRFFPSSKTCNECDWKKVDLKLSDREWVCEGCGLIHDRDLNASKNILKEGLRLSSSGIGDYTLGDINKTSAKKHKSMKSEDIFL